MLKKERIQCYEKLLKNATGQLKEDLILLLTSPAGDGHDAAQRRAASARVCNYRAQEEAKATGKTRKNREAYFGSSTHWNELRMLLDALPELDPPCDALERAKRWVAEYQLPIGTWGQRTSLDHLADICAELGAPTPDGSERYAMGRVERYERAYEWVKWHDRLKV